MLHNLRSAATPVGTNCAGAKPALRYKSNRAGGALCCGSLRMWFPTQLGGAFEAGLGISERLPLDSGVRHTRTQCIRCGHNRAGGLRRLLRFCAARFVLNKTLIIVCPPVAPTLRVFVPTMLPAVPAKKRW